MIYLAISSLLVLAGTGTSLASEPLEAALQNTLDRWTYPRYAYNYAVNDPHSGDNKAQWEQRDGDKIKGSYSLVEPDGSLRVVEYNANDHSGFNAIVKRLGPNLHPTGPLNRPIVVQPAQKTPASWAFSNSAWPAQTPLKSNLGNAWNAPRYGLPLWGGRPIPKSRVWRGLPKPIRYVTITQSKNGFKKWIAGPIPVIPGHVFVVKRKYKH